MNIIQESRLDDIVEVNGLPKSIESQDISELESFNELSIYEEYVTFDISPSKLEVESASDLTGLAKIPLEVLVIEELGLNPTRTQTNPNISLEKSLNNHMNCTLLNPTTSRIISVTCLTGLKAIDKVIELTLSLSNLPTWNYIPGDSIGIICPNPDSLTLSLLRTLNLNPNRLFKTSENKPHSYYETLRWKIDLYTFPKKSFFRLLSTFTTDPSEQRSLLFLSSIQGTNALKRIREQKPNILDILYSFPSVKLPFNRLLEVLPILQPRYYSIASSPLLNPLELKIAFNVIRYYHNGRSMGGLCSSWLDDITKSIDLNINTVDIPIFIKSRNDTMLVHPEDVCDLIMIGAGTGITPFISLIEHASQLQNKSNALDKKMWLFQGCRFKDDGDALYSELLNESISTSILTKHSIAYSREESKEYVQDRLKMNKEEICAWVDNGARIYVCGSLAMSKGVHSTLVELFTRDGTDGTRYLFEMTTKKSYVREIWG